MTQEGKVLTFHEAAAQAVLRLGGRGVATRFSRYLERPDAFAREVLGIELYAAQERALLDLVHNQRVALKGGHGTGKTLTDAVAVLWFLSTRAESLVLTTSSSWFQVEERLWAEIRRRYQQSRVPLGGKMLQVSWGLGEKWKALGLSTDDPSKFWGGHAEHVLVVFNEAPGVRTAIWDATEGMMVGPKRRWLVEGNPLVPTGPFHECFRSRHLWRCHTFSCLDHPNVQAAREGRPVPQPEAVTLGWIEERQREWGENHPLYQARVLGDFPGHPDDTLVTVAMLEAADAADPGVKEEAHLGVDIAYAGLDDSVALLVENRIVKAVERWHGHDTMASAGRIVRLIKQHGLRHENVHVDAIGVGAGVVHRLQEEGFEVEGVNVAEAPAGDWIEKTEEITFPNRRSELHYVAARLLKDRELRVPARFGDVWRDITEPRCLPDSRGRLAVEPKDKIRRRLGRSPDAGDALTLALSRRGQQRLIWVM